MANHYIYGYNPESERSSHGSHHHSGHHHKHRRHGHGRRGPRPFAIVLTVVVAVLVVCGVGTFLMLGSVNAVRSDAASVASSLATFQTAVSSGDADVAEASASSAAQYASDMHQETQRPIWAVAEHLPVVGQDVHNVRALSEAADTLATGALVPIASASSSFSLSNLLQDSHVDVDALQSASDTLASVAPATQQAADTLDSLEEGSISEVNDQLANVREQVDTLNTLASGLSKIGSNLSSLLGADGQTKNYLIMALNNAEIRPAGGWVGSVGVLAITDGTFEMGEFASPWNFDPSQVTLTDGQLALEGQFEAYIRADRYTGNSSVDPNFPGTAQIARDHYQVGNPDAAELDGVIGVDPIFLQSILALTGGVTAADGTEVDGTNAAQKLLNDVYLRYPTDADAQDEFLSDVASRAFDQVLANLGSVSVADLSQALATGAEGHNLQMWFADDALETDVAEGLGVDGALETDPASPQLGVYFFTAGGTKMDWYLSDETALGEPEVADDGTRTYAVTTTIGNHVTAEEAAQLPAYIAGDGAMIEPVDQGEFATIVYLYAPAGGSISDVQCEGVTFSETNVDGFDVWAGLVKVGVSSSVDVSYTVATSSDAASDLTVRSTATAQEQAGWV